MASVMGGVPEGKTEAFYSPLNSLVKGWFHTQAEVKKSLPKQIWDRMVKCFNLATSSDYLTTPAWVESK